MTGLSEFPLPDKGRSRQRAPCRNSSALVAHVMLLRIRNQLIEHRFTFGVNLGLVIHYIFHADPPMRANFTIWDGAFIEKLDQERPGNVEYLGSFHRG